ncbi:hypothetical protein GobsT_20140 [Gemmata obscuriglobus]|uniref:DUF1570 domain-containing protein n=1 Tax=Gemmata obscuriglobus TaxID=114 RepID=A0A2Z3H1N5_9BACT|nr:hypothetical protein [Gemmata obscuriglobus]AWM39638.1 hypothetical protein C1280_23320 [Gemmata obscuriglobus]QEG27260.1 hypothetical protein GobsT_20140 [Gemmata obscuriglobus]VTS04035.1 Uncharacterized protein OS=Planctomyces limnophilus (strain ATCC 43296 / DSM 3776 / IFAM 1008 / 290) GN=Plim_0618 PE=4 SV=1: Peptidase_MA_2 [Gemmata obscuriglobus UQM 2246]
MPSSPLRLSAFATLVALIGALAGCETMRTDPSANSTRNAEVAPVPPAPTPAPTAPPGKKHTRAGYYVLYHDFEIDKTDPLFAELDALPDQVFGELKLPPSNGIVQVFLFDTQERYERYMRAKYRNLPPRRAYFIAEPRAGGTDELKIFTWLGDHLSTDLRHELTHALLRGVLKDVPLWLDEGLAGYFELPPNQDGVNAQHLDTLRRGPFQPDLARLEKLKDVAEMQKPEYREAWAWVHLMLRSGPGPKKVLHDYLQALRADPAPGPLLPKLREVMDVPEQALADHLGTVEAPKMRTRARAGAPK